MLPFPIMNQYGNKIVKSTIHKVVGSGRVVGLLYTNGNLYMRGSNLYRNFGIEAASNNKAWVLVQTNVKDVWLNNYHTVVQTFDNQFLCAGYGRSLGYGGTSYLWMKYDRLYTLTPTPETTVKTICLNINGVFVLLNNNSLYAIGFNAANSLGFSTVNSTVTAFTLTRSNTKYIHSNLNGAFAIGTNNLLYAVGSGQNFRLGNNSSNNLTAWTAITLPAGYTYPVMAFEGYIHTLIYAASDSSLTSTSILYSGYTSTNPGGAIPSPGSNYVTTFSVGASGKNGAFTSFGTGYLELGHQSFYTDSLKIYSAGSAGPSLGSSTNKSTGFTEMPLPNNSSSINSFCSAGNTDTTGVTFAVQNNLLYAAGDSTWLDATTYNFVQQQTPE